MNDEAIPAATLVVARDRANGPPEYLMVERAGGMAFAAGALVFPGGRIDDSDRRLAAKIGTDEGIIAAIRETVEETAIPVGLLPLPDPEPARALQDALVAGEDFAALLERFGLRIDPAGLVAFARWVPKFHAVRRFDTMFYIAACPTGDWQPRVIEGECTAASWITAVGVLEKEKAGSAKLIFPTRRNLERLAKARDFASLCADAEGHPIEPISPWVEERDGRKYITIPAHLGYPVTSEPLDGQWRG